ncbi:MAG: SDR family oxidoreductase [Alphaproteobacteria bacterium]
MTSQSVNTCIVTGGAGFIGSHLVDRLLADGHRVRVIDNFVNGRHENLINAMETGRLEVLEASVADIDAIAPAFDGVDWVFHMAAMADIVPSIENPEIYHDANVNGTLAVLECSRKAGIKRFIYAASSSCYGMPEVTPTPETAEARPMYPYALTKYVGEQYAMHWGKTYGLPVLALRMFNVFGPRHRTGGTYGAVFGVFLAQKLAGKPLTVVGDGTQTRDFTFITDIVEAFVMAAESDVSGRAYNLGSDGTYSINHLVELLGGEVVHIPKRPGEPDSTYADITAIKRDIGWTPKVSFEDGVAMILEHIEGWREAPVWTADGIEEATADWFKYLGDKT